ncbi:endothelin-converting enzyme homolog isoform X2 [Leptopilina heterotoma]|uniref:endothelin-converting enzyme homolog isoform X2 n=1 Tax=Leptopilina heterotoma TaxID=63436 RepID=UPI001CA89695|nr:endothelin-converting enzyme homolog isoform X2 [Leptopilina heterotoma]
MQNINNIINSSHYPFISRSHRSCIIQYACGRWPEIHPLPESSLTNSWFSERSKRVTRVIRDLLRENSSDHVPWAVEQAKTLYKSCMDLDSINAWGLVPLLSLLKELDLPQIPAAFTKKKTNFVRQMARVKRILGKDIFFGMDVYPDPRNKSRNTIILDTPTTETPFPNDKEIELRLQKIKNHMLNLEDELKLEQASATIEKNYMIDAIKEVISNGTVEYRSCKSKTLSSFARESEVNIVVNHIYDLGEVLYKLRNAENSTTITEEDLSDEDYMEMEDLQKLTDEYVKSLNSSLKPKVIWRPFIEEVFKDIITLNKKDIVLVADLEYLKKIAYILSSTEEELLETVIWWSVIDVITPFASKDLRQIWTTYLDEIMEVEIGESRSMNCATAVNDLMGMAVSWLFVERKFHNETEPKVKEMVDDIKEAFASMVIDSDWMDGQTKTATLEKNKKMSSLIGYPRWLFNKNDLNDYYEGIDLSVIEYMANMMQIVRIQSTSNLKNLHDLNSDDEPYWATDPTNVNAFHTFQANQITIPIGILQFPFYDLGLEALNYGAIGTVLGHELTHGFDNSGRQYDGDGNVRQWWTKDTIEKYKERTKCFVEQYNSFYEEEIDEYVDGELTLGENIADNSGLKEAVLAYKRWQKRHGKENQISGFTNLTHEQLLFLGFAHLWCESYTTSSLKWMLQDSHSPGHIRLKGVLRNSQEFSSAWNCPLGSKMNPEKKCSLW